MKFKSSVIPGILISSVFAIVPAAISSNQNMEQVIDSTASFLVRDWISDPDFKDYLPPQVLSIDKGSKVYGGCGAYVKGDEVAGSSYCPVTHTIFLEPEQLSFFYENFG